MTKSINRNILWAEIFAAQLEKCGLKNVCFSPGSRSTALTFAFSDRKKISTHLIIDERSSGFFALGLAKQLNQPVALVTTSGTAVAELYPAIIEAYQSRIPLIICTADRPPGLRNSGANQTINQDNIFANHIRWFKDLGLPSLNSSSLKNLKDNTQKGYDLAAIKDKGPVHFNLPFEKPFEPDSYTDKVDQKLLAEAVKVLPKSDSKIILQIKLSDPGWERLFSRLMKSNKGIIFCGGGNYPKQFIKDCIKISKRLQFPILLDGTCSLRYSKISDKNIVTNFPNFLRSEEIRKELQPDLIIQFGKAPTSQSMLGFIETSKAELFLVDEFGDIHDSSLSQKKVFSVSADIFCKTLNANISSIKTNPDKNYLLKFQKLEAVSQQEKEKFISTTPFPFEGKIIHSIVNSLQDEFNLVVSNSMPVRDLDFFVSNSSGNNINLYCSRGASGIDGVTSTAMGIASQSKLQTILVTGDLAFFHDLNGLALSSTQNIPLTIVLINNNGGGIFEMLPIASYGNIFNKFFKTPHNLDLKNISKGFGASHFVIKGWKDFQNKINASKQNRGLTVLELRTDSTKSLKLRKEFWNDVTNKSKSIIDEFS